MQEACQKAFIEKIFRKSRKSGSFPYYKYKPGMKCGIEDNLQKYTMSKSVEKEKSVQNDKK